MGLYTQLMGFTVQKCSCKKFGIRCSDLCKCGDSCTNVDESEVDLEEWDMDYEETED